jgi:hypothetical protein
MNSFFWKRIIIHFVNVEIDPRQHEEKNQQTSNKNNPDSWCVCKLKETPTNWLACTPWSTKSQTNKHHNGHNSSAHYAEFKPTTIKIGNIP